MPSYNTTIDDPSPLILYYPSGAWTPGSSTGDAFASSYSNGGTFTVTNVNGASATFVFNGTGIWIFGANRPNHAFYQVFLDGALVDTRNGSAIGAFQIPLFSSSNMPQGLHNITLVNDIVNTSSEYIYTDIDFIIWESEIGNSSESITTTEQKDTSSSFNYQPSSSWTTDVPNINTFQQNSGHGTTAQDAKVTLTFNGDAVALFGPVGQNSGPFQAVIDSQTLVFIDAFRLNSDAQQIIYFADNLGPGQHQLVLVNQPLKEDQGLYIDYAEIYTVPSVNGLSPVLSPASPTSIGHHTTKLSEGAIIGISVTGAVFAVGFALAFWFLCHRRRKSFLHRVQRKPAQDHISPFISNPSLSQLDMRASHHHAISTEISRVSTGDENRHAGTAEPSVPHRRWTMETTGMSSANHMAPPAYSSVSRADSERVVVPFPTWTQPDSNRAPRRTIDTDRIKTSTNRSF